jgi:hypothetical protein
MATTGPGVRRKGNSPRAVLAAIVLVPFLSVQAQPELLHAPFNGAVLAQEHLDPAKTTEELRRDFDRLAAQRSSNARAAFYMPLRLIGARPLLLVYSKNGIYSAGRFDDPFNIDTAHVRDFQTFRSADALAQFIDALSPSTAVTWLPLWDRLDPIAIETGGRDYYNLSRDGRLRRLQVIDGRVLFEAAPYVYMQSDDNAKRWEESSDQWVSEAIPSSRVRVVTFEDDVNTVRQLARAGSAYQPPPVRTLPDLKQVFMRNRGTIVFLLGHNDSGVFVPPGSIASNGIPIKTAEDLARKCCKIEIFPVSCESFQSTGTAGITTSFLTTVAAGRLANAVRHATAIRDFMTKFASAETPIVVEPRFVNGDQEVHIRVYYIVINGAAAALQHIATIVMKLSALRNA